MPRVSISNKGHLSWADLLLHFCGEPLQTTGINQPFLCARSLLLRGDSASRLIVCSLLGLPLSKNDHSSFLRVRKLESILRLFQTQPNRFSTSAMSRPRNLPEDKLPFVPDLELSI
jgi:hypothetical protein